jgi:drug/metabolite transporter (DMT)-like permease
VGKVRLLGAALLAPRPAPLSDALRPPARLALLLTVVIWGLNFPLIKLPLEPLPPFVVNALRFRSRWWCSGRCTRPRGGVLAAVRRYPGRIILLGLLGFVVYQLCFILGVDLTTSTRRSSRRPGARGALEELMASWTGLAWAWTALGRRGLRRHLRRQSADAARSGPLGGLHRSVAAPNAAVRAIGPSHTAMANNLVPVIALIAGAALLGESIRAIQIVGGAAIIAGLVLMRRARLAGLRAQPPAGPAR